jgi:hypothetical protein
MWTIILYFLIGIVYDVAITIYYLAISDHKSVQAGVWSFCITGCQLFVFYELLVLSTDVFGQTLAFAIGCGVGTVITVEYYKHKKKNRQQRS